MKKILIIFLICFFNSPFNWIYGEDKIIKVDKIIFKGLNNLSKFEILNKVKMKAVEKGIFINLVSLKKVLKSENYIKEFKIDSNNKRGELLVSIIEKIPYALFGVYKNNKIYTIEMDKEFSIIDINNSHMKNFPIVIISEEDYNKGNLNQNIKLISKILNYFVKKDKFFLNQMGQLYYSIDKVKIILKGRRTEFFLKPVYSDFIKLKYIAGHLDKSRNYPEKLVVADRIVYR